ncbi:hypothetical protein E4U09_000362 [Claviceps aff. purpurea]|uniref:Tyrosinase copper-binding domain-containing protein n=1 Tax=Claviceps aff. purpurea TaxID=1967640 RepID=A0A9P7QIY1_9HYPO|nr:hypothetical protein E4U09_000362 [Claviceps aff. purpurea]
MRRRSETNAATRATSPTGTGPSMPINPYNLQANPLYDGSETSMGSNGRYIPDRNSTVQPLPVPVSNPPALYCPPGTGGGYVKRGPFAHWTLHLGPVIPMIVRNGMPVRANPRPDGLGYNPRRMIRDFNNTSLQENNSYKIVNNRLTNMTVYDNDFYTSPGDPLFYFHHAQVDRIWSIWQALDFSKRGNALDGTLTLGNVPPSRNVALEDIMSFDFQPSILVGPGTANEPYQEWTVLYLRLIRKLE